MNNKEFHEVIVRYVREGQVFFEPWCHLGDTDIEALNIIKTKWHKLNDHLFFEAKNAKFFMMVE